MSKNKTAKEKRPWHILIWLILYLANLLAALAFQYFFIHTYSAPLTAESLGSISYFNGCEILDISGEGVPDNSLIGKSSPDWILYKIKLVRLMLYGLNGIYICQDSGLKKTVIRLFQMKKATPFQCGTFWKKTKLLLKIKRLLFN